MQGQIIRVQGKFSNSNLPKLSDFDTSSLLNEILSNSACKAFYDLTDESKFTISDGLVLSIQDLKGGSPLTATVAQAPKFNASAFSGRGGIVFSGGQRMTASGLFQNNAESTVVASVQLTENTANGLVFAPLSGTSGGNLYASPTGWRSYSGGAVYMPTSMFKRTLVANVYKPDLKHKQIVDDNIITLESGTAAHLPKLDSVLNVGANNTPDLFLKGMIGHVAVFNIDITSDLYLMELLKEFHKRQYNV